MFDKFEIEKRNQYDLPEGQKYSTCPLCSKERTKHPNDKCLMIDWERGLATCQHCGQVIQIHTYKKHKEEKKYVRPTWKNNTSLSNKAVKWFEGRKISQVTLSAMQISEGMEWMPQTGKEENTIQFNYFRDGELINVKYRTGAKHFKLVKDAEKIFYNLDCCRLSKEIVIVEGEMDALSYIEAGIFHVVSVPNGSTMGNVNLDYLDNCIDYFENKETIYLALDKDEAGQNVQKEFIRRLGAERCKVVELGECKDANELLMKHGKDAVLGSLLNAKQVPIMGVSSVKDWTERFENYLLNGMKSGYRIGKQHFDGIFSTYTGQYIVVTGVPSSGKSDFVDEMCIGYGINYDWKTAVCSIENKPNEIHAGKVVSKLCGKWINKAEYLKQENYLRAIDWMDSHFKYIDLDGIYDLDSVLDKARSLIVRYGIKCLVLDPYNKIRMKSEGKLNINEYTADYLLKIDEFARKYDILIILVAHPVKPSGEERKNYEPDFYSIKGGGEFYDMTPHGLLVSRDYDNDCVKIKVLKVKFAHLGKNNEHVFMKWDLSCGRYNEYEKQNDKANECFGLIDSYPDTFSDVKIRLNPTKAELQAEQMDVNEAFDYTPIPTNEIPF